MMHLVNLDARQFRCTTCQHVDSVTRFDCLGMDDGLLLCNNCAAHCPLLLGRDDFMETDEPDGPVQLELGI